MRNVSDISLAYPKAFKEKTINNIIKANIVYLLDILIITKYPGFICYKQSKQVHGHLRKEDKVEFHKLPQQGT
jgi:hypothetical protein